MQVCPFWTVLAIDVFLLDVQQILLQRWVSRSGAWLVDKLELPAWQSCCRQASNTVRKTLCVSSTWHCYSVCVCVCVCGGHIMSFSLATLGWVSLIRASRCSKSQNAINCCMTGVKCSCVLFNKFTFLSLPAPAEATVKSKLWENGFFRIGCCGYEPLCSTSKKFLLHSAITDFRRKIICFF